jgi:hypothetical protein
LDFWDPGRETAHRVLLLMHWVLELELALTHSEEEAEAP